MQKRLWGLSTKAENNKKDALTEEISRFIPLIKKYTYLLNLLKTCSDFVVWIVMHLIGISRILHVEKFIGTFMPKQTPKTA